MAWAKRTATDFKDCLQQIHDFVTKNMEAALPVPSADNAGDGLLYGASASEYSSAETWTLTCKAGTGGGVVVTGSLTPDATGTYTEAGLHDGRMSYDNGTYVIWWDTGTASWYVTLAADVGTPASTGFFHASSTLVGNWSAIPEIEVSGTLSPDMTGDGYFVTGTNDGKDVYNNGTYDIWWHTATTRWFMSTGSVGTPPTDGFERVDPSEIGTWTLLGTATGTPTTALKSVGFMNAKPTTTGSGGVAEFSVTGSVSGAKADATSDVPYSIPEVSFTPLAGAYDFLYEDEFTFAVALATPLWVPNESDFASAQEYILLQGKGTGADEIFVGFRTWTDNINYFNMEVSGFSGYDNTKTYDDQPGKNEAYCCMSNVGFDFHIFMTGRAIKVVSTIGGTIDEHMYAGFFLPVATPAQNGYPMFIGGNSLSSSQLIGQVSTSAHVAYWAENRNKLFNGVAWTSITNFHPLDFMTFNDIKEDLDGNRVVFPATLLATDNVYGDMEGVGYITNSDSAVTTHDFLNAGNVAWLIFQDTTRVGVNRIAAFDLMGDI